MDVAAGLLNITTQNYAVGGSTSGAVPGQLGIPRGFANLTKATTIFVPSTIEQVTKLICRCFEGPVLDIFTPRSSMNMK